MVMVWPPLGKKWRVFHSSGTYCMDCWHTDLLSFSLIESKPSLWKCTLIWFLVWWSWCTDVYSHTLQYHFMSHCQARYNSVPLSKIYYMYHSSDSACMAAGLWTSPVWIISLTLSTTRSPLTPLSKQLLKTICSHGTSAVSNFTDDVLYK